MTSMTLRHAHPANATKTIDLWQDETIFRIQHFEEVCTIIDERVKTKVSYQ